MKSYSDFGIEISTSRNMGNFKTFCPQCHGQRRDKRDKSLSVNLERGIWHCHYCNWSGTLHVGERANRIPEKRYKRPTPPRIMTEMSAEMLNYFKDRGISEHTLTKAKVSEGEHFMPQLSQKAKSIRFNYYLDEELINVKYRTLEKHFCMEAGAELIPYNINSITGKRECIITEGEIDCLSFIEAGYSNCISVPNGANNNLSFFDDFIDGWFEDKSTIYIAVDNDTKGQSLKDELVRRFGSERCRIVSYGDDCKDANEHLVKYGAGSLRNCITNAKDIKIEGVFSLSDFEDNLDSLFNQGMPKGVTIGHSNFDDLCSFETKRLAIITGIPSSGKSEFLDEIAERLNIHHGWKFAFFSPENAPLQYHASKIIEKLTGKKFSPSYLNPMEYNEAKNYVNNNFFFINPKDDFNIDTILSKAKYLVRRYGIKGLVIDPYNRLDINTSKNKETDVVRDILRKLTNFAQQNDVLVFLMAHPTKLYKNKDGVTEPPTLYDIAGSAHFFNMADYGIVVHRDRVNNMVQIRVDKIRFKHLGSVGTAFMHYNLHNGRYVPFVNGQGAQWDNSNHLSTLRTSTSGVLPFTENFEIVKPILQHYEI